MATVITARVPSKAAAILLARALPVLPIADRIEGARQQVRQARREHRVALLASMRVGGTSVCGRMGATRFALRGTH